LIGPLIIVVLHEFVQVLLGFLNGFVELLSESDFIEFVLYRLVESFSGTIGLRMSYLCPRVLNPTQVKEELIRVSFDSSAILGASIR